MSGNSGASGSGVASVAKYKQRIAMYEAADDPLAPLTASQRQFISDLTHGANERRIPKHLKPIPVKNTAELVPGKDDGSLKNINFEKFNFHTKYEVRKRADNFYNSFLLKVNH